MKKWQLDYHRGLRALAAHKPVRAIRYFERALLTVPTTRSRHSHAHRRRLARLFYYFAVALRQSGLRNRAIGSLVESSRLMKRGVGRRSLLHSVNQYGMARHLNREQDDQQAFYGIQLSHYVRSKQSHRLGTRAEIDMVAELIDEYWDKVRRFDLEVLTTGERVKLFSDTVIVFPFMTVPQTMKTGDFVVDFRRGTRVGPDDRCTCGSGLPFRLCHGRIPGIDEVIVGVF